MKSICPTIFSRLSAWGPSADCNWHRASAPGVQRVMVYGTPLSPKSAIGLAADLVYLVAVLTARFRRPT